ncbi:hypothetical protein C488_11519 [Natrinema pellirubrum DSM 15624]|uniref:Uncharacterized protein n=1 Tax=Natrinema pellirubrum (strain DSM 15624 / CIP 106293 / JCM 10476 / NCIMB 786 / 157) TaxID=797303 RepID=L0JPL3_NATP1|nr:DUF5804 family protein [Natrinema pellirubrum]AGB32296.1 hypothetical protein Natpe_2482 [Natrinema pellirubrum DSM 15624]ELY74660.1 hypothetical protein C488_11519 [Natrinema pellirubrum DSM 15624]
MTRVCLIGEAGSDLQYELLSRETAREALATYDLERPFENSLALRTVSVGAAVSLLNDLNWYCTRFVDEAFVQEPSISDDEWLSRALATQLRNGEVDADETGEFCKIYGLERVAPAVDDEVDTPDTAAPSGDDESTTASEGGENEATAASSGAGGGPTYRLVEPLYVRRTDGDLPEYDLRDVAETLVVRLTETEYTP